MAGSSKTQFLSSEQRIRAEWAFLAAVVLGAGVSALSWGDFLTGWLITSVLLAVCFWLMLAAWEWGGKGRVLAWMMILAFGLRLVVGIGLSYALPAWGYRGEKNISALAGYPFKDAYERDIRAWQIAHSGDPLLTAFTDDVRTDQYGGLLALSALLYRYYSPDGHRAFLILILGAFFAALGVPFLRKAVRLRWNERTALTAAWVYVLYPDAVFFQSSQMREPFLVFFCAVAFWALLSINRTRCQPWLALFASLVGMAVFSSRMAVVMAGVLAVIFLLDKVVGQQNRAWQVLGWLALSLGVIAMLIFSWVWFRASAGYDVVVTMRSSGSLLTQIRAVGEQWAWTIVAVRGVTVPFLPAAIAEPSIPLWQVIGIIRALGWYVLAPFLVYGLFSVWKEKDPLLRRLLIGIALSIVVWLFIASLRGGGDVTDNPRYRSLFIVWMALLAGWAVDWALAHRDAWLWRWMVVEVIFLGFFTSWYLGRYYQVWQKLPFWEMVVYILLLSGLVLAGGWVWDHRVRKPSLTKDRLS